MGVTAPAATGKADMIVTVLEAVVVVTREGVIFEGAAGRRDLPGEAPMTPDSVVWIAAMTKALVRAAALQLVASGALAVAGLLPALAHPLVLEGFGADGRAVLRPRAAP
jgi:CubicO group peptidase (beta-lactamase class C family)